MSKKKKDTPADPPAVSPQDPAPVPAEKTYFQQFCQDYHITPENNTIKLKIPIHVFDKEQEREFKIYQEDETGSIDMLIYSLDRFIFPIPKDPAQKEYYARYFYYSIKRYKEPRERENKKTGEKELIKYSFPKVSETHPFFPPPLVRKYESGQGIDTLVLTEGHKKAFYASLFGLDIVGLTSITHIKDKDTGALYSDIIKIVQKCAVKNIIILFDGDCRDISPKALQQKKDLYQRPIGFINAVNNIRELFKDLKTDIYFSHVNSESLEGSPKGIDDILQKVREINKDEKNPEQLIIDEILQFSQKGRFIYKTNITQNTNKLYEHFHIKHIDYFYLLHQAKLKGQEFVFRGTKYKYNEEKNECQILRPAEASDYFRVGDTYFKFVDIPNKYKQNERTFQKRQKGTIIDDWGKPFIEHVNKYEAFCNVPSHVDFIPVINNCFNVYNRFEHEAEEGETYYSRLFLRHIFGEQEEMGLDYIQLLYQDPTQVLPILCLVSPENNTGKSTFVKWMKAIFTANCTIIGNDQFNSEFNANWATKLLIACEESFIEKKAVMEKIKALSTGDKIGLRMMQKDPAEIDFFGKFILCSNNEENFIIASRHDIRFWVRKILPPEKSLVNLLQKLISEIPAFLHYLSKRDLVHKNESRMFFRPDLLVTDALKKLIEANKPKIEREIEYKIKELFIETGLLSLEIPIKHIFEHLLNRKYEETYIRDTLAKMGLDKYKNEEGNYISKRVTIPILRSDGELLHESHVCRPYVFLRDMFISETELTKFVLAKISDPEPVPEPVTEDQQNFPFD